ncbi:hypothetical protein [Streptomyces sp. NPDC051561]|uniref:hypothetical protein n=1 Tax=Streptomyces sp. NPDC051561 TaxID=3365658 RepID=UPI0037961FAE
MNGTTTQDDRGTDTAVSPVGTWVEHFSVQGEPKASTLHFTPGGQAFILAGPANGGSGAGTWQATGPDSFAYRISERIIDVRSGEYAGWVDIDHHAVQDGDSFVSTGHSRVYDAEDHLVIDVGISARGSRKILSEKARLIL